MTKSICWRLWTDTMNGFWDDKVPRLGAALAFYTTFSVAPLLVLSVAMASLFYGEDAVQGQLKRDLVEFFGKDGADGIQAMVAAAQKEQGSFSSVLGVIALLLGATGVFVELKDTMNTIWDVPARKELAFLKLLWDRAMSFAMILSIAFLLLVSLVLSAAITALSGWARLSVVPTQVVDLLVSTVVVTLLFTLIFKYLPDTRIDWADVWIGALMTSFLFALGKQMIGIYLGSTALASAYGAAGSLMIFLLWTYYSSQILFLGAEFTKAFATLRRNPIAR